MQQDISPELNDAKLQNLTITKFDGEMLVFCREDADEQYAVRHAQIIWRTYNKANHTLCGCGELVIYTECLIDPKSDLYFCNKHLTERDSRFYLTEFDVYVQSIDYLRFRK